LKEQYPFSQIIIYDIVLLIKMFAGVKVIDIKLAAFFVWFKLKSSLGGKLRLRR